MDTFNLLITFKAGSKYQEEVGEGAILAASEALFSHLRSAHKKNRVEITSWHDSDLETKKEDF